MPQLKYDRLTFDQPFNRNPIAQFIRGEGRAIAFVGREGDTIVIAPMVWEVIGSEAATPQIVLPMYGDAEMFHAAFLSAVDACLKLSEACAWFDLNREVAA